MEKGGGLSISSDPPGFFLTKPPVLDPFLVVPKTKRGRSPISAANDKRAVGEVDFFSDKSRAGAVAGGAEVKKVVTRENLDRDVNTGLQLLIANTGSDQSSIDDGRRADREEIKTKNELMMLKAEVERVNEENRRLRTMFHQVTDEYRSLQKVASLRHQIHVKPNGIDKQKRAEEDKIGEELGGRRSITARQFMEPVPTSGDATDTEETLQQFMEPAPTSGDATDTEETLQSSSGDRPTMPINMEVVSKEIVSMHSNDHLMEENSDRDSQGWINNKSPHHAQKSADQQAVEATMRKARVSVRARSEAPMITDGCQWRKYGQKMAKGNPCPRAYYRCTMAAGCPVRKQVQRCAEDRSILITTYEGTHNHPLPPAAMAMASTTSAAACMLLSGSMPSADGLVNSSFLARTLLPCSSSMATISASAPFPTVTLDLTQTPTPLGFQKPNSTPFSLPFGNAPQLFAAAPPAQLFGQSLYNQSTFSGLQLSGSTLEAAVASQLSHQQQANAAALAERVSAITADPNFTSALAAAITSIIGSQDSQQNNHQSNDINNTSNCSLHQNPV